MKQSFVFPDNFIWGTAVSSYQTEGDNKNSDWWEWEQNKKEGQKFPKEKSGIACDSYNRYEEDLDLCVKLNNNAFRLSLEWSRIEPKRNEFDKTEIEHYKKVLISAKHRNLKTFVTLHHFTVPIWFAKLGGWSNIFSPYIFAKYAKKCAEELGGLVDAFLTINEPQVYMLESHVRGIWPPNIKNLFLSFVVQLNLIKGHKLAFSNIKSVNKNYPVGIVKNIVWYEVTQSKFYFLDKLLSKFLYYVNCDFFIKPILSCLDLIGLNYYFTSRIECFKIKNPNNIVSDLNWWINPEGLKKVLIDLKRFALPIYITENGLADSHDILRQSFIENMLFSCYTAIKEGVDLRGYFYWSLIDNFEWHEGFWPRFGLVEIDRENNLARVPRRSFYYYADICKNNSINLEI